MLGRGLVALCAAALCVAPAPAAQSRAAPIQSNGVERAPFDAAQVNRWIDKRLGPSGTSSKIGPAVIVVVDHGKLIAARAYGFEDPQQKRPVTLDRSLFRLASVSKVFTATAVAQLLEQGRIHSLDDPVNIYLKRLRIPSNNGRQITIRQLLTHTAGFEELTYGFYTKTDERTPRDGRSLRHFLPGFARPADQFLDYSNFGAAILGLAIEDITGLSYADYLRRNIFAQLGMSRAIVLTPRTVSNPDVVVSLQAGGSGKPVAMEKLASSPLLAPAAGVTMSAADMLPFMLAVSRTAADPPSRLLSAKSQARMFEPLARDDPAMMALGEAWFLHNWNGERVIEHGGDLPGTHSMLTLLPERHAAIFIASANEGLPDSAPRQIDFELLTRLLGPRDFSSLVSAGRLPQRPFTIDELAGRYVLERGTYHSVELPRTVIEVSRRGDGLEVLGAGRLRPIGPNLFAGPPDKTGIFDLVSFQRASDGSIMLVPFLPFSELRKVSFWADPAYAVVLAGGALGLLASSLFLFFYRDPRRPARVAKRLPISAFLLSAAFACAMILPLWGGRGIEEAYEQGSATGFITLILLAHLIVLLALGATFEAVKSWRERFWGDRFWGSAARVHFSLLALAAWALVPLFLHMHLLGLHLP